MPEPRPATAAQAAPAAFGQIRIDASGGTLPGTTPPAHRGPMFAAATPQIVTDVNPMVMMLGTTSDTVNGYDVDASGMDHNGEPMAQMIVAQRHVEPRGRDAARLQQALH